MTKRTPKPMDSGFHVHIPDPTNGGTQKVTITTSFKAIILWLVVLGVVGGGGAGLGGVVSGVFNPPEAEVAPATIQKAVEKAHEEAGQRNAEAIRNVQTEQRITGIKIKIIEEDVSEIKETGKEMRGTLDEVLIEVKAAARARTRQ